MKDTIGSNFNRGRNSEPAIRTVNPNSSPLTLKITDMRYAIIVKPRPSPCPIIRVVDLPSFNRYSC